MSIHWSLVNVQCVLALVDTRAKCSLIYGNSEWFPRTATVVDGKGGKAIRVKQAQIPLGIGYLCPKENAVYTSPVPEYIWGIDILQGIWLQTTAGEFRLRVRVVKAVLRGHAKHSPIALPVLCG